MKHGTWMDRVYALKRIETPIYVNKQSAQALGRKLRQTRLSRGVSVLWICEETRLYPEIIKALEEGRYEGMYGIVYCKGYLRTYAAYLGLDVTDALKIFQPEERNEDDSQGEAMIERSIANTALQAATASPTQATQRRPPKFAEYLLHFFIPREQRAYTLGDLEQEYGEVLDKFGPRPARLFYYGQAARSLRPYLQRSIRRVRSLLWLIDIIRSIIRLLGWH